MGISLRKELIIVGNQRVQRAAALSSKINESKSNRKICRSGCGRENGLRTNALKTAMHKQSTTASLYASDNSDDGNDVDEDDDDDDDVNDDEVQRRLFCNATAS